MEATSNGVEDVWNPGYFQAIQDYQLYPGQFEVDQDHDDHCEVEGRVASTNQVPEGHLRTEVLGSWKSNPDGMGPVVVPTS